jgi:hypothetical protein
MAACIIHAAVPAEQQLSQHCGMKGVSTAGGAEGMHTAHTISAWRPGAQCAQKIYQKRYFAGGIFASKNYVHATYNQTSCGHSSAGHRIRGPGQNTHAVLTELSPVV